MRNNDNWWPPREIKFTWEQVEWLLSHYALLREGQWPPDPRGSGYTEIRGVVKLGTKNKRRRWAGFETSCDVAAEIDERMRLVGEESSILRDIYMLGMTIGESAALRRMSYDALRQRKINAMNKMTGWRRKR